VTQFHQGTTIKSFFLTGLEFEKITSKIKIQCNLEQDSVGLQFSM
jgi:hypothetical protein